MAEVDRIVGWLGEPALGSSVLGWDELRRLAAEGVVLAPHSRTHPLLGGSIRPSSTRRSRARGTISSGRSARLRAAFAYPSGSHSDAVVRRVGALGVQAAFTTVRGVNDLRRADPWRLRRINVGGRSSPALIRAQALGWLAR